MLDFLNTRPALDGRMVELLPDLSALLRWFQAAGWLRAGERARLLGRWAGTERARRTVRAMRRLREKLRREVLEWQRGRALRPSLLAELNRHMARHPMRTRLKRAPSAPATELWYEPRRPEDLFAPLAYNAAALFTAVDRTRVRQCARCVGLFHDTSKKGMRRWCSMRLCGNRAKVAAYAARQRLRARRDQPRRARLVPV